MSILLIQADARSIPLADKSVQCVVTSPPYWGLRDYGTAVWDGGSEECGHIATELRRGLNLAQSVASTRGGAKKCATVGGIPFRRACLKCGAVRTDKQLGLEDTPEEYVAEMVDVFREVRRVLRDDGTLWMNMGDSYCNGTTAMRPPSKSGTAFGWVSEANQICRNGTPPGCKPKDLMGMPWTLALALRADGWFLRCDIIWSKPNPMPESVTDRPTKAHEYIFLLAKSERYFYNADAIAEKTTGTAHSRGDGLNPKARVPSGWDTNEGGHTGKTGRYARSKQNESFSAAAAGLLPIGSNRNKRSVWEVAPQAFPEAHFATFPEELIRPCILAGCPPGGVVLDPFMGSGTTALVARNLQCHAVGLELNPAYIEIANRRLAQDVLEFA